jgi:hypothetical protein
LNEKLHPDTVKMLTGSRLYKNNAYNIDQFKKILNLAGIDLSNIIGNGVIHQLLGASPKGKSALITKKKIIPPRSNRGRKTDSERLNLLAGIISAGNRAVDVINEANSLLEKLKNTLSDDQYVHIKAVINNDPEGAGFIDAIKTIQDPSRKTRNLNQLRQQQHKQNDLLKDLQKKYK